MAPRSCVDDSVRGYRPSACCGCEASRVASGVAALHDGSEFLSQISEGGADVGDDGVRISRAVKWPPCVRAGLTGVVSGLFAWVVEDLLNALVGGNAKRVFRSGCGRERGVC